MAEATKPYGSSAALGAFRPTLPDHVGECASKAWEYEPTIEASLTRNDRQLAGVRVDAGIAARWIDDPHQLRSGVEPLS